MSRVNSLAHRFVEVIPEHLEEGIVYVSIEYATAVHKCCCGCGLEVVTPISPTGWELTYDGVSVSLDPSIGSWDYPCHSHYFIWNNQVRWAEGMSREEIELGRERDKRNRERYYESFADQDKLAGPQQGPAKPEASAEKLKQSLWQRIKSWFSRLSNGRN